MEKFLQTCFLGYLCLIGGPSSAQSRVAESPGVDLLHKVSGPNRGGETLSDTFLKYTDGIQVSGLSSPIGETAASLSGAPRSDDSGHPSSSIRHPIPLPSPAPVTVFLVHRIPESAGNLIADLWDTQMFGLEGFSNHQRMEVAPMEAHLLTGLMPKEERGYRFRTPSISKSSVLRLSLAAYPVIRDYQVSPGDSIMIMLDEKTASLIFTGPSAPKFRLQKELDEVFYEFAQSLDIPLSFNTEIELQAYLDRPGNRAAWDSIAPSFGRKTLLDVAGWQELVQLKGIDVHQSVLDIQRRLSLYKGSVEATDLQAIYASGTGKIFQLYINRLSSAYSRTVRLGNPELTRCFRDYIQTRISALSVDLSEEVALRSPEFREYLLARALLQTSLSESDFFDTVFELYTPEVADRIGVQYLSDMRRRLPDFEHQAMSLDARLMSPQMKRVLAEMTGRFGQGAQLFSFDLPILDGNRITSQDFEGKTMLIDFWITGCGACKSFHERIFNPLIEKYGENPDLRIISVCADPRPDYWKLQGGTPDVSHKGYIPAFAERISDSNSFLSHYNIHSYPQLMLVRPDGTLFRLGSVPTTLAEAETLLQEAMKAAEPSKPNSSPSQSQKL